MTRALDIPQKQILALCRAAKKEGYVPEFQIGKTIVRLIPEEHAIRPQADEHVDGERKGYL